MHCTKLTLLIIPIVSALGTPAAAQTSPEDARASLEAIYGIYHVGTYCRDQGVGFTDQTLAQLKDVALGHEASLGDEALEGQLWEETGKTAGMLVGLMSMDKELMSVQCGQLGASVHTIARELRKPF